MDSIIRIAQVIVPIFVSVFLGMLSRKKSLMTPEEVRGMQQFVMKFGLPCVVFNACLTANVGAESLGTMLLILPFILIATLWAFRARGRLFSYHNFPMLFAAQESGMLGIPLYMILFGAAQAYRMGILDITQAAIGFTTIAILTTDTGEKPSPFYIAKKVLTSPLMVMSLLGLFLNLTGIGRWMDSIGIGGIVTQTTSFLSQPVSAMMIFSVGYNFSLAGGNRKAIFRVSTVHFFVYAAIGLIVQLGLFLIPGVDAMTRWAVLMYSTLPPSYLAPGLGKTEEDFTVTSGVCSILTAVSLGIFCVIAIIVA